jgi:hypothetical protein
MSTIIQIKRSANIAAPSTGALEEGELAYSYDKSNDGANAKLFIEVQDSGSSPVIHTIGGKYYTDKVDSATSSANAFSLVSRDSSGSFTGNVITATTFVGNVTGFIEGVANSASKLATARNITLTGDLEGNAYFDGTGDIVINANVKSDTVTLGTDTTGDYVSNVLAGTGIVITGQGGETATPTVALTSTGVTANTYGGTSTLTSFTVNAQGRITSAANLGIGSFLTADSIATLTNKTFDTAAGSNNTLLINGNQVTNYSGSGSNIVLDNMPTLYGFNIGNSDLNVDGGTGTYYWSGQSGVAQAGDLKAGVYASSPTANNSLFTFGTNGSNYMSIGVEGSLFVGTSLPSNSGGLNSSYAGWLVVQSGGKFGGDIDTLGGLNLTDPTNGKITFSDGTIQRTAYTSNHLTTANVVELTNLYFTNARARAAITSGNTILYDSSTGNITLSASGVTASTYGGSSKVPVVTVDQFGRVTAAANIDVLTSITLGADSGTADPLNNNDVLRVLGGTGIDTAVTDNTITVTLETTSVVANTYGGASKIPVFTVDAQGRLTSAANVSVAGVSTFVASGNTFTITTADGGSFSASIQENSVRLGTDTTGDYLSNVVPGTGLTGSNFGTEGATPTISLASTSVTAGSYGGTTQIPTFVVDQQGRLTSAANVSISTDLSLVGDTGTDTLSLASETLAIKGGTGISTSVASNAFTIVNTGVTSLTGTTNEITVSAANGSVQIGLPDDVTVARNLTVEGNLYVTGNVVAFPVENFVVEDSLIQLANNNISADVVDIGFYGSYNNDGGEHEHAGLFRDASDSGKFKLFQGLQGQDNLTSIVNVTGTGYSIATLVANLTGGTVSGLAANITVSDGGTGRGTLTTNAVIYGQGTSAVGLATGTAYQVLQLDASGVPVFGNLDGGSY